MPSSARSADLLSVPLPLLRSLSLRPSRLLSRSLRLSALRFRLYSLSLSLNSMRISSSTLASTLSSRLPPRWAMDLLRATVA